ncbi:MAG TPA: nicotinate-nucleotide adenylyltransferase [Thermoanaerobaculia bacterium]|nr:nicotinate-nucleotide adenylyltransferase [Thermoanaerobaculia bacterium]
MNIGVCGGTFDPFHRGHLEPVLAMRREMSWDRVIYVPAWRQPFKVDREASSPYHRFAMSVLATQNDDSLYVSQVELERGGISYTVDTLQTLHTMYPGATFDWIIGDDNVTQLMTWKDPEGLFRLARFVVLARGGPAPAPELAKRVAAGRIVYAHNESVLISSTEIRKRVRAGQSIDAFVDPVVSRYIQHYGLYKEEKKA